MPSARTKSFNWARDELILALDLYFRRDSLPKSAQDPDVMELSQTLRQLPLFPADQRPENFRNLASVYFKLLNFHSIATDGAGGYPNYGAQDVEVWNEFADERPRLHAIAQAIRQSAQDPRLAQSADTVEDVEAPEGRLLLRLHRLKERNTAIVRQRKQRAMEESGTLACEVCDFDFGAVYGTVGTGYIECHHTVPLAQLTPGSKTRLHDLALVCANCHRMLHRTPEVVTLDDLRGRIVKHRANIV